jgi:pimeloyl-ACP methyl ester carboxylesterase
MQLPGALLSRLTPKFLFRLLLRQVYGNPELLEESTVERYYLINRREGNRTAFLRRTQQSGGPDISGSIASITVPTLILWGEKDSWISPENGRRFNREIPDSRLVLFAEAGHVPMEELPARTAEELHRFLAPLAPAGKNE